MTEIKVTGNIGEVVKLNYKGSTLELKLDADRVIPDVVESVLMAIKEDPNTILVCANQLFRPNVSGEIYVRDLLTKLKDQIYLKIDALAERSYKPERPAKKAPEQSAPVTEEVKPTTEPVEEKTPEPTTEDKPATEEKKAATTTTKKSSSTTKKTTTTTTAKKATK